MLLYPYICRRNEPQTTYTMRIALLQTDIKPSAATNMDEAGRMMDSADADLYLLPEMWATGFDTSPGDETARAGDEALAWMVRTARERGCAIGGSLAVRTDGAFRNRFFLVGPGGIAAHYDKRHLFTYGGEPAAYTAGRRRVIVEMGGLRLLLLTCYDLRFPVFSRSRGGDYDVAVYVANWPASRQGAWETLLRARAIENQCYVCGVNRTGTDSACRYAGGTMAVDPYGRTVTDLGATAGAAVFEPDVEALRRFRHKFPVLADADAFSLDD